jgi:hypothetical protein
MISAKHCTKGKSTISHWSFSSRYRDYKTNYLTQTSLTKLLKYKDLKCIEDFIKLARLEALKIILPESKSTDLNGMVPECQTH